MLCANTVGSFLSLYSLHRTGCRRGWAAELEAWPLALELTEVGVVSSPRQGGCWGHNQSLEEARRAELGSPRGGWGAGDEELARLTDKAQQEESEVFQKAGNTHRLGEAGAEGGTQAAGESLAGKMLRPLGALGLHPIPALQRRGAPGPRKVRC